MMRPHMGPQGKTLSITPDKALFSVEKYWAQLFKA